MVADVGVLGMGDVRMNWYAFFVALVGVPLGVAIMVGFFHVVAFIVECAPWWIPVGLILLIIATFFGLVIES